MNKEIIGYSMPFVVVPKDSNKSLIVTVTGTYQEYDGLYGTIEKIVVDGREYIDTSEFDESLFNKYSVFELYLSKEVIPNLQVHFQSGDAIVTIPEGIEELEDGSFYQFPKEVTLPSTFKGNSEAAIFSSYNPSYYNQFTKLTVKATTPPLLSNNSLQYAGYYGSLNTYPNLNIFVPAESVEAYKTAPIWNKYADRIYSIPETVDLDLPSGTLWATMNVEDGTGPYSSNLYMYGPHDYYREMDNPLPLNMDNANIKWGGGWHSPTKEQFEELINNTTYTWVTNYNDSNRNGGLFTAQNGSSIFLLADGQFDGRGAINYKDSQGYYFSSTPYNDVSAYALAFDSERAYVTGIGRGLRSSIRPVIG